MAVSAALSLAWGAAGLPAALLLGPLIGGIVFAVNGRHLAVPRGPYLAAQALIGAMVSASITPDLVTTFDQHVGLFVSVMAATLAGAAVIGWSISRYRLIPGASAVYGTSPGAASAMVLLAEAEGADTRVVAFMQYSRVLMVALAASLVARFWPGVGAAGGDSPGTVATGATAAGAASFHWTATGTPWLAPLHWGSVGLTLGLALLAQQVGRVLRLPAWALLGPLLALSGLHAAGWLSIDLPRGLLALAYALLGWHIGLGFSRDALIHTGRALPVIMASTLCLMGLCGLLAGCLTRFAHVNALTAYLATSPGGLDSVAIIAASTPSVDLPFVLALQSMRLLFVIALSPLIVGLVVRHSPHLHALPPHS